MLDWVARPWLVLLAPVLYWLLRQAFQSLHFSPWQQLLPAGLAERLLVNHKNSTHSIKISDAWLAGLLTLLFTLALVGPGSPVDLREAQRIQQEVVIIQRLAPPEPGQTDAMALLDRSQQLLVPFLNNRDQGQTALIFYSGSAHLASPMTGDSATLRQLMSLAHPSVMPLSGDDPAKALGLAAQVGELATANRERAALHWLWITDRLPPRSELEAALEKKPAGAELLLILTQDSLSADAQQAVAGQPLTLVAANEARAYLDQINQVSGPASLQQDIDWQGFKEQGHWFLLPALLLLLWHYLGQPWPKHLPWQRSLPMVLLGLLTFPLAFYSQPAAAWGWQNQDYQAWRALQKNQPELTLQKTQKPRLLAEAWFQLEDYPQAALAYEEALKQPPEDPDQHLDMLFNTGTAWLFSGQAQQALSYFEQVKQEQPEREDNCINHQLALRLVQQEPLPSATTLQELCKGAQPQPPSPEVAPQEEQPPPPDDWQPQRAQCPDCLPLSQEERESLEQLQEDPWRLLRNRFRWELREQGS